MKLARKVLLSMKWVILIETMMLTVVLLPMGNLAHIVQMMVGFLFLALPNAILSYQVDGFLERLMAFTMLNVSTIPVFLYIVSFALRLNLFIVILSSLSLTVMAYYLMQFIGHKDGKDKR